MTSQIRFLFDGDFDNDILRGVLRRMPGIDVVRVQDVGLSGASDAAVLEWAAAQGRVVFTHDVTTMKRHALERVQRGLPMPGVFAVAQSLSMRVAIEDILLLAECSEPGEWEGQILHLPL